MTSDFETLSAFIDGQVDDQERERVRRDIESNPAAATAYAELQHIRNATMTLGAALPPDAAWKACVNRLNEIDGSRRAESFVGRYAWGMCGAFFLLIAGAGVMNRMSTSHLKANDVSRMASLSPFSVLSHPSQEQVGKFLQDAVGPAPLRNLTVLTVVSAQAGTAEDGRPFVRLTIEDRSGQMALFVIPNQEGLEGLEPLEGTSMETGKIANGNCVAWNANRYEMVLVGERPTDDLVRIAEGVAAHMNFGH